jgi:hypothetical protein
LEESSIDEDEENQQKKGTKFQNQVFQDYAKKKV